MVLSEDRPDAARTIDEKEIHALTEVARLAGCRVLYIPTPDSDIAIEDAIGYTRDNVPLHQKCRSAVTIARGRSILSSPDPEEAPMLTADYNTNLLTYPTLEDKVWGPAELLELEDRAGIERAVIVPESTLWPDNEGLAKAIAGFDRFIGCAIVNPQFGDKAVDELERCVVEYGFRGVKLQATFHGNRLVDHPTVDRLMAKARELAIPVTVHSGSWNAYPLQIAVLADRFPDVPVIMEHSGYRWFTQDALAAAERCPNIHLGLSIIATETVMVPVVFKAVGPERMLFGSDAPSAYPDLAAEAIRRQRFGREAEELIFGGVLARLYHVS